jgi:hypothetical protein
MTEPWYDCIVRVNVNDSMYGKETVDIWDVIQEGRCSGHCHYFDEGAPEDQDTQNWFRVTHSPLGEVASFLPWLYCKEYGEALVLKCRIMLSLWQTPDPRIISTLVVDN